MQTTDKVIRGITYERNYLNRSCTDCVAMSHNNVTCIELHEINCAHVYSFKIKDITRQPMTSEQQNVGLKYDDNKLQYSLIPPFSLAEMVKCLTFGAKKYAPENWKKVSNAKKRYLDATMRHIELFRQGEVYDKESAAHHLACAMTNLAFYLEFEVNPELKGD